MNHDNPRQPTAGRIPRAMLLLLVGFASWGCSSASPADASTLDARVLDAGHDGPLVDRSDFDRTLPDGSGADSQPVNPADRYPQINDVRTIGKSAGADYESFVAAIADLADRPLPPGGVLFRVEPGSYEERFVLSPIEGSGADRPVVFAADGGAVTVGGKGTDAVDDAMITLAGCDHVTFDSIDIVDGGSSAADRVERGYFVTGTETDGATYNTLRDCAIRLGGGSAPVSPLSKGVFVLGQAPDPAATQAACSHNRFERLRVDHAAEGIVLRGATKGLAGELMAPDVGNVITGCTLGAKEPIGHDDESVTIAYGHGISVSNNADGEISDNTVHAVLISKAKPLIPSATSGISAREFSGVIFGNRVLSVRYEGETGSQVAGIRVTRREAGPLRIYNNFISGVSRSPYAAPASDPTVYVSGIRLFSTVAPSTATVEVAFNTAAIETPADAKYSTAALNISGGSSGKFGVDVRGNILINLSQATDPAGSSFAVVDGNTARDYLVADHNLLWVSGAHAFIGVVGRELAGTEAVAKTLADWQKASGQDTHTKSKGVTFVDLASGDLHLDGPSLADADLRGVAVSFVVVDIDGDARAAAPTVGADEAP